MSNFYETEFSNVGRSVHTLAVKATNRFEASRDKVKDYINAKKRRNNFYKRCYRVDQFNCIIIW